MTLILPVKHIRQQSNWDCGLTCLRMLIDYYKLDLSSSNHLIESYECNKSTWTIDLLYLLHQLGIHAALYTKTIGCSPIYEDVPYYEGLIHRDRERVDKLFTDEASNVKVGSVEWSTMKTHLIEQQIPCVVLVDANKLKCYTCQTVFDRLFHKIASISSSSYQGHYILVIGYQIDDSDEFIRYVDPAKNEKFCTTTKTNFDLARTAFGTDEDVILCYKRD